MDGIKKPSKFNFPLMIGGRKMENNKAICRKTDDHFTEGKEYECTSAYAKYESAVVDILDNNKELITVEINDKDFQFIFN